MMNDFTLLNQTMYDESIRGGSIISGNLVEIIGEQTVQLDDGKVLEQYLYNIEGYTAKNGKPFVALKANICVF